MAVKKKAVKAAVAKKKKAVKGSGKKPVKKKAQEKKNAKRRAVKKSMAKPKAAVKKQAAKKLHRSAKNKMIAGVCGGVGEYLGVDPTIIRLAWAILTALFWVWPGIVAYAIAALVMPKE